MEGSTTIIGDIFIMDSLNPNYNPFEGKKKGAHYTPEQIAFIKELVDLGWSANKIATTYHLGKDAIRKRIKTNDWVSTLKRRDTQISNDELKEIKIEVDSGIDYQIICDKHQISMLSLLNRITNDKWERSKRKNKYTFNENYFDEITTEHQAYWLGFLYADGYILSKRKDRNDSQSFGFTISSKDSELFVKFKEDLQATNPVHYYKNNTTSYSNKTECGRILLTSQHTVDSLKKLGVMENKTFFLKAPPIDKKFYPAFIRGYSDGDGSIIIDKNNKYEWQLLGTKELLTAIQSFFNTDIKLHQRFPEREKNNYTLLYGGNQQVPKLLDIVYQDATIFLQRKYNKYAEMRGIIV